MKNSSDKLSAHQRVQMTKRNRSKVAACLLSGFLLVGSYVPSVEAAIPEPSQSVCEDLKLSDYQQLNNMLTESLMLAKKDIRDHEVISETNADAARANFDLIEKAMAEVDRVIAHLQMHKPRPDATRYVGGMLKSIFATLGTAAEKAVISAVTRAPYILENGGSPSKSKGYQSFEVSSKVLDLAVDLMVQTSRCKMSKHFKR